MLKLDDRCVGATELRNTHAQLSVSHRLLAGVCIITLSLAGCWDVCRAKATSPVSRERALEELGPQREQPSRGLGTVEQSSAGAVRSSVPKRPRPRFASLGSLRAARMADSTGWNDSSAGATCASLCSAATSSNSSAASSYSMMRHSTWG